VEIALRRREQEVWQACDDLWALQGDLKLLTGDAIREHLSNLGKSRGSPNEIYKYRKSWMLSRRIEPHSERNNQEHDPISRAVRMVHEKLLSETNEKIEELKAHYEALIDEKEQELEKKHKDLSQVTTEFGHITLDLQKSRDEINALNKQLNAEREIYKVLERELMHNKLTNQHILEELKASHQNIYNQIINNYNSQLERLESEKKALGIEFSDKITAIKTHNYNQELVIKDLKNNIEKYKLELSDKYNIINNNNIKLDFYRDNLTKIQDDYNIINNNLLHTLEYKKEQEKEIKHLRHIITKNQVLIARLRAMQTLGVNAHERKAYTQERVIKRSDAAGSKYKHDKLLQNSRP
jgi:DNA repair exonuclease SbcCD ATPase subunit